MIPGLLPCRKSMVAYVSVSGEVQCCFDVEDVERKIGRQDVEEDMC